MENKHDKAEKPPVILFVELEHWEQEKINSLCGSSCDVHFSEKRFEQLTDEEIPDGVTIVSPFVQSDLSTDQLAKMPDLQLVATRSTGFDMIDIETCTEHGIHIANVPVYGDDTVAEHAFAMLLALTRKIHRCYERTSKGNFSLDGLRGIDLAGKTFGCLGVGSIGAKAMRIAGGFGMNRIAFDLNQDPVVSGSVGFRYVSMDDLFSQSDVLSLHVPLNEHTRHIVNAERLAMMKPSAILINTARGGVVDTSALLDALVGEKLAGAGLDVLENEQFVSEEALLMRSCYDIDTLRHIVQSNALLKLPNVIITPHNAFNSHEARQRIIQTTMDNIHGWLEGKPQNIVNR